MRPEIKESIDEYARIGRPLGGFLSAVMENDFMEAFARADEGNIRDMFEIANYVYNHTPRACHGSPNIRQAWIDQGGKDGAS